jgi:hypothetical protein
MKSYSIIVLGIIVTIITAGAVSTGLTAPVKKSTHGSASVTPQDKDFAPGFDDLMTMLVQPRHIKLYYAGSAKNWELAAAESRDLRSSFDRIAQGIPNYENFEVKKALAAFITPKIGALDAAIAAADAKKFSDAYYQLTTGCNDCHTYMEHPFLVIRVPAGFVDAAHPDQDFKPSP